MTDQLRRYTFKIYPNSAQDEALREQARMCAQLWNALLEMRETFYRRQKQRGEKKTSLTAFDQGKDITALRGECLEWRAQPRGTQERVAEMLDLAFKAFFRRAKEGAGAQSGYPRFKSVMRADSVHLREPLKSSWRFTPRPSFSPGKPDADGPCGAGPRQISSSAEGESPVVSTGYVGAPAEAGGSGGERRRQHSRHIGSQPAEAGGSGGERRELWSLILRGVPGAIKARGRFPIPPTAHKTADIRFYDGAWWFSICVAMPARRERGAEPIRVALDLIGEFASVKDANGQCVPGLNDPFSDGSKGESPPYDNGLSEGPGGNPVNEGGPQVGGKLAEAAGAGGNPVNEGEPQARVRLHRLDNAGGNPVNEGEPQGNLANGASSIQSARDRRFKRGSIRWTREKQRIARIKARDARRRREALHRWSTRIARLASDVEITAPPKRVLRTGRGDEQFPGAEVSTIAALNRRVLDQAPASAIQMLEYKLAEAGGNCVVTRRDDHEIRVGSVLRAATTSVRKAKRALKKAATK